ncbi:PIG-L family deacetylase [Deinococcus depolymerans]|uniref:PIG-L family deacetylase n=2 Tax=Deinococcus depolymerans TaxID=392408 RepID=A0ABN1CAN0_9DEIO
MPRMPRPPDLPRPADPARTTPFRAARPDPPRGRRRLIALGAVLVAAAWINLPVWTPVDRGGARVQALPVAPPYRAGQRVLVLSPHPDDETLCCAASILQARAAGAEVFVAWITPGDGFEFDAALTQRVLNPGPANLRALGDVRASEARRAVALLGVDARHTLMLGYPDGGLFQLFTLHYASPLTSPRTGAAAVYVRGALRPGRPFTGQALEADLRGVLRRVNPDVVLAPAPQDFHPDHRTVSFLALRLMAERHAEQRLRFWVVHGGLEWPLPKGLHLNGPLTVPPRARALPWQRVPLTPAQQDTKRRAVEAYGTQTEVLGRFMRAFVRRNELLSPQALPGTAPAGTEP